MLCSQGLGINAKNCLYEEVIVPTALNGAETCREKKVNILQTKCLIKNGRSDTNMGNKWSGCGTEGRLDGYC